MAGAEPVLGAVCLWARHFGAEVPLDLVMCFANALSSTAPVRAGRCPGARGSGSCELRQTRAALSAGAELAAGPVAAPRHTAARVDGVRRLDGYGRVLHLCRICLALIPGAGRSVVRRARRVKPAAAR